MGWLQRKVLFQVYPRSKALPTLLLLLALCASGIKVAAAQEVFLNHFGFLPYGSKIAIVPNVAGAEFWLVSASSQAEVLRGPLSQASEWGPSRSTVKVADFTAFNKPGRYKLRVDGLGDSQVFTIGEQLYDELIPLVAKSFYLHRAGIPIESQYAQQFKRPAGHPDLLLYPLQSSSTDRGALSSVPKGWFAAGDYDKHTVNTAFAVYFLLQAYSADADYFGRLNLNIPESRNELPDVLDEIVWGLDWLMAMQDSDGGVFQRVGAKQAGTGLPSQQSASRYVYAKSSSATLFFAAVSAHAARVLSEQKVLPQYREKLLAAAQRAWQWADKNPRTLFTQPAGVKSQVFAWANDDLDDERAWAAAELAHASGQTKYLKTIKTLSTELNLQWQHLDSLAWLSLLNNRDAPNKLRKQAKQAIIAAADRWVSAYWASGYLVPLEQEDFVRGSNYIAINRAFLLLKAQQINDRIEYRDAARALFDYLLGRNPLALSYLTGVAKNAPTQPRDWLSQYDKIKSPIPGLLVGGPVAQTTENCKHHGSAAALRYADSWCSEDTNQVSLAGSAAFLFVASQLREEEPEF